MPPCAGGSPEKKKNAKDGTGPRRAASSSSGHRRSSGPEDEEIRALLHTFQTGLPRESSEAFASLTTLYMPLLRSEIDSFRAEGALDGIDREDLLQEASIVLLRAARTYRLSQTSVTFGLYLKICLRNAFISLLRRHRSTRRKEAALRTAMKSAPGADLRQTLALFLGEKPSRNPSAEEIRIRRVAKLFSPPQGGASGRTKSRTENGAAQEGHTQEKSPLKSPALAPDGESDGGMHEVPDGVPALPAFPRTPSLRMLREELLPLLTPLEREVFLQFYGGASYEDIARSLSRSRKAVDNALSRIRKKWRLHYWGGGNGNGGGNGGGSAAPET